MLFRQKSIHEINHVSKSSLLWQRRNKKGAVIRTSKFLNHRSTFVFIQSSSVRCSKFNCSIDQSSALLHHPDQHSLATPPPEGNLLIRKSYIVPRIFVIRMFVVPFFPVYSLLIKILNSFLHDVPLGRKSI